MEKYMGNKSKICDQIYRAIKSTIDITECTSFFDPFSGTTNVSRYFKKHGINIICNDINDLSYVLAKCYIECSCIPTFEVLFKDIAFKQKIAEAKKSKEKCFDALCQQLITDNKNTTDIFYAEKIKNSNYIQLLTYLTYYASKNDWDDKFEPYFLIQNNYCENGSNSRYINQVHKKTILNLKCKFDVNSEEKRLIDAFLIYPHETKHLETLSSLLYTKGMYNEKEIVDSLLKKNLVGCRKFFSLEHGERLDIILNLIKYWYIRKLITEIEFFVLLTAVIESATIFSNTSATYQAFYKDYRANTMQRFRLVIPEIDESHIECEIYQQDVINLIPTIKADVLYLDPPYNWRQYDSNYHLLNTIAKFHRITDWKDFEHGIVGASGENREKKLNYTSFNTKRDFEELLIGIIENSNCHTIVLSYSDSTSNHERDEIGETLKALNTYFGDKSKFEFFRTYKIQSVNFESRKGNKKADINELLFVAKKANH